MTYKRVHIIGGAGSGKTTLSQAYSQAFGVPHYELDNIYYSNAAAREKRSRAERDRLLGQAVALEQWVVEGIFWQPWVRPTIERADKIIVLAIPERIRHLRVITRHFRLLSKASPKDYSTFFPTLFELLKHNRVYHQGPLQETLEVLAEFSEKVLVFNNNADAALELGL